MGSFSEDEECRFFDAQEDVVSIPDEGVSNGFDYEVWIRSPRSVRERRGKFMKRMGLSSVEGNHVVAVIPTWLSFPPAQQCHYPPPSHPQGPSLNQP